MPDLAAPTAPTPDLTDDANALDNLEELQQLLNSSGFLFDRPMRFSLRSPLRGGSPLRVLRAFFKDKPGNVRFSCTPARLFIDFIPGAPLPAVCTLDAIARSDAHGLERMLQSAVAHVDWIIIGIDGRSDAETHVVAEAFADEVHTFNAADIGLTEEEWAANKIHFSNARNIGRSRVTTPWTLVLDTDEYFTKTPYNIRDVLHHAPSSATMVQIALTLGDGVLSDTLRLCRTHYRWHRGTHNQLNFRDDGTEAIIEADLCAMHDTSLRTKAERARRTAQRLDGHADLIRAAEGGDLNAAFHVVKQYIGDRNLEEAVAAGRRFRECADVRGPASNERAIVACGIAQLYYEKGNAIEAELWAFRALLDKPVMEAFYRLGELAEDRGDLHAALFWFDSACRCPGIHTLLWADGLEMRWNRRESVRQAIKDLAMLPTELQQSGR